MHHVKKCEPDSHSKDLLMPKTKKELTMKSLLRSSKVSGFEPCVHKISKLIFIVNQLFGHFQRVILTTYTFVIDFWIKINTKRYWNIYTCTQPTSYLIAVRFRLRANRMHTTKILYKCNRLHSVILYDLYNNNSIQNKS